MTTRSSTYPLRLPVPSKEALEKIVAEDGTGRRPFIVTAVAEKIAVLKAAERVAERRARADLAAFDRLLSRAGGEPPRPEDDVPEDLREAVARLRHEKPAA